MVVIAPTSEVQTRTGDTPSSVYFDAGQADIQAARALYLQNNYDPIPLKPQSKNPAAKAWQSRPTITQWHNTNPHANIGLRAGNGKAFIDCDDKNQPGTTETITRWLAGLGYQAGSYPMVRTPSGGAHIYVNFTSEMMDSKKNLLPSMGAGEFRYGPGAYVGAWPSVIDAGAYVLVSGDIARPAELDIADVRALISVNEEPQKIQKKMSRLAAVIANGTKPDKYQSTSEGEAALVLSLINSGYTYEDIKHVFSMYPCLGHYSQKHAAKGSQEGERWLYMTYQEMLRYSQHESPARRMITQLMEKAQAEAWSNANRKKVYLAHLEIAHRAGKTEYAAGVRDIAVGAGVHKDTASNQTKKLVGDRLSVKEPGNTISATVYSLNLENLGHSLSTLNVRKCPKFSGHDAFRNGGGKHARNRLGRRAGEIYELIYNNPLTLEEIVKETGAQLRTVIKALVQMREFYNPRTGSTIEMVSCDNHGKWYSNLVDLDVIAAVLRTYGATGKQKRDYQDERKAHRRSLELGTITRKQEL